MRRSWQRRGAGFLGARFLMVCWAFYTRRTFQRETWGLSWFLIPSADLAARLLFRGQHQRADVQVSQALLNGVVDGSFGEEALRPERWMAQALKLGVDIYPYRISSSPGHKRLPQVASLVEVVGHKVFGDGPKAVTTAARDIAAACGLGWGTFTFDRRRRLLGVGLSQRRLMLAGLQP